jgi:tRNA A-37 threonylcarbamoyl transferase component Bud32
MILRERTDVLTYRENDTVVKVGKTDRGLREIRNSVRFLRALQGTPFVPDLLSVQVDRVITAFVESTPINDSRQTLVNSARMLLTLKEKSIIHGDLTEYGFILYHDVPILIDFDESRFSWELSPVKRAGPDSEWFYPALLTHMPHDRVLQRWIAIDVDARHLRGYGTLVDIGTCDGIFVGLALSSGYHARGIDNGYFNECDLVAARKRWNTIFMDMDAIKFGGSADIILLLSVFTYIEQQHGLNAATALLKRCVERSGVVYFEGHRSGDGFATDTFTSSEDERQFFESIGIIAERLADIPVIDRETVRTLWRLTCPN